MNELNTKLQDRANLHMKCKASQKGFIRKLQFLSSRFGNTILTYMSTVKEAIPSADPLSWYLSTLGALHNEFSRWFEDFKTLESEMHMISAPFTCSLNNGSSDVELELIDLQSNSLLAERFNSVSLLDLYSSLAGENFPHIRGQVTSVLQK